METSGRLLSCAAIMKKGLLPGLLALSVVGFTPHQSVAANNALQLSKESRLLFAHEFVANSLTIEAQPESGSHSKPADFKSELQSRDVRRVAEWVVASGDNRTLPFAIVDKVEAKVFVFDADGRLRGAARALLGLAKGDDSIPGIGDRKLSDIRPEERTTPAGRFVASLGYNAHGKDVLWVDYAAAVSMHRVITSNPAERRLQRLATPTSFDKRISYGCINVPADFFNDVVHPSFMGTNGIVYVLPEIRSINETFAKYYDVDDVGVGKQAKLRSEVKN